MACNPIICTILFGLFEMSKITLFNDLVGKIIEAENCFFLHLSVTLASIISRIKSLNKVILDDSNRPNKLQIQAHVYLSTIV